MSEVLPVLTPYAKALKMGKDKLNELKIPFRVKRAQKQAELAKLQQEETAATLESELQELCSAEDLNFESIIRKQNALELKRREITQYQNILDQMFPCSK